ncbi:hypothetical protein V1264_025012 [Littorina saxatilis]|uniref:Uncharacterized protein n=1 Tax=Littorina saxatilis TaxID=31220 RepID=A0AAN9AMW1_9CAEN
MNIRLEAYNLHLGPVHYVGSRKSWVVRPDAHLFNFSRTDDAWQIIPARYTLHERKTGPSTRHNPYRSINNMQCVVCAAETAQVYSALYGLSSLRCTQSMAGGACRIHTHYFLSAHYTKTLYTRPFPRMADLS